MFAVVLAGWVGMRIALWDGAVEDPAKPVTKPIAQAQVGGAKPALVRAEDAGRIPLLLSLPQDTGGIAARINRKADRALGDASRSGVLQPPGMADPASPIAPRPAASRVSAPPAAAPLASFNQSGVAGWSGAQAPDRWSADAWGFWRQGSASAPISQGRVPIYGASQVGAIIQFRPALGIGGDIKLFARGYRALVNRGETEVSMGVSTRPLRAVPLRAFTEMRYIEGPFLSEWRPSAFVITELPRQNLPGSIELEAYGQAGWVGGSFATPFVDGQMTLVREVASFAGSKNTPVRLSLGGGAWGGAQQDASRIDMGPHMRVEWQMGSVPARLSVDWRERISGDAAPDSGLAATLSTSF